jgi:hypothetical protein
MRRTRRTLREFRLPGTEGHPGGDPAEQRDPWFHFALPRNLISRVIVLLNVT